MSGSQSTGMADGLPQPQRFWAILTISLGLMMAVLDGAIANIALPAIARELDTTAAASIWVVNAYQLAIMVSLLPFSSLGDLFGYRHVYRVGMAVFVVASLCCVLSDSLTTLVLSRILQGFGAAGIMSVNGALVRYTYPRASFGFGIGLNALIVATTSAAGPTIASAILAVGSWQWLFAINVPIGILTLSLALWSLPRTDRAPHKFDVVSAVLSALTFGLLILGVDGIGHGQAPALIAVEFVAALAFGILLVRRQAGLTFPLLPVDLFRRPAFSLSAGTSVCSFAAQSLAAVSLPFYFIEVLGRSQVETGLLMTPWPLAIAVAAPIAGRLADRYPAGVLGTIGLVLLSLGLGLIALLPDHPSAADIVWRMVLCGIGFGMFQSPNNRLLMSSAPITRSGGASGVLSTARLLGQTSGAALVGLSFGLANVANGGGIASGVSIAVGVGAGFAALAAIISSLRLLDFGDGAAEDDPR